MKKLKILVTLLLIIAIGVVGCSSTKDEDVLTNYVNYLNEGNYKQIYSMLSKESKEYIGKEEFLERYTNIYSAINAKDIKIIKENSSNNKSMEIPYTLEMDTIAGKLKLDDYKLNLVKEEKELKIKWDESLIFPQMKQGDKVGVSIDKGIRGQILDRNGNILAGNGKVKHVGIYPAKFTDEEDISREEKIEKIALILDIDKSSIEDKLNSNTNPHHFVPIVKISENEINKIDELLNVKGILINTIDSRVYTNKESLGNLVGYVGNITAEELEKNSGYNSQSLIGKSGLEKEYENKLKATDGGSIYINRGEEKIDIIKKEASNGKDVKVSIDSLLQDEIYSQMNNEKGASVAVEPTTGEVLAMVSSPSYNSNTMVTYKTNTIKKQWEESKDAPFYNRFNKTYSPGSTFKIVTASLGLENNIIDPNEKVDIQGLKWQKDSSWGGYSITRVKDPQRSIDLIDATKYSDNIYYGQLALKLGQEKLIEGAKNFAIGRDLEFDYKINKSQISNNNKLESDILLADTGYGQGEVLVSPLDVSLMYSALSNDGKIMQPILDITNGVNSKVLSEAIDKKHLQTLINAYESVISHKDGTGSEAKLEGVKLVGKTGTAELKKDKDDKSAQENGWFVATNVDAINDKKVSISMIIENTKDRGGSSIVVPRVRDSIAKYIYSGKI